jgi:hypothetical protein
MIAQRFGKRKPIWTCIGTAVESEREAVRLSVGGFARRQVPEYNHSERATPEIRAGIRRLAGIG